MLRAYWRCNGGHYFSTKCCPFDGWSSPEVEKLFRAVQVLESEKIPLSLSALRSQRVGEAATKRCMVVEFGDEQAVFDAFQPKYYVISGKSYELPQQLPREFM
jgi:hypothetical protein